MIIKSLPINKTLRNFRLQSCACGQSLLRLQRRDDDVIVGNVRSRRRDVDEGDACDAQRDAIGRDGRHREVHLQVPRGLQQGRGRFK